MHDAASNVYRSGATSHCQMCPFDSVGLKLNGEETQGADGIQVKLDQDRVFQ